MPSVYQCCKDLAVSQRRDPSAHRARLASQLKLAFIEHFVPGGALGTVWTVLCEGDFCFYKRKFWNHVQHIRRNLQKLVVIAIMILQVRKQT